MSIDNTPTLDVLDARCRGSVKLAFHPKR